MSKYSDKTFEKILDDMPYFEAKIPVAFYYGDYMEGKGPDEIDSTHFGKIL